MLRQKLIYSIVLALLMPYWSNATEVEFPKDPVKIKLKWLHQFQFAGFYAAQIKGYYKEEGLDVELIEGSAKEPPIDYVLNNINSYGVSSSELIEFKAEGKPIVLVSSIFQHSPYVIISLKNKNILKPSDLIGKKVMVAKEQGMIIIKSMLGAKNIAGNKVQFVEHTWNNNDITNGHSDAMTGYITAEPFQLEKAGYKINVLKPQNFGVDFYGDMLFTSEEEVNNNPNRVLAIKRASNKGWEYAMSHIDEMCDYILSIPGVVERGITKENLIYEAVNMQQLVKYDIVEFGHINKSRINKMIRYYEKEDIIKKNSDFRNFIFDDQINQQKYEQYYSYFWYLMGLIVLIIFIVFLWNRQLRKKVQVHIQLVQNEYENRIKAEKIARDSEERLELALSAARLGIWDSNLLTGQVYRNNIWSEMLGYSPFEIEPTYDGWRKLVHPEDYEIIDSSINAHHDGKTHYNNYEHRLFTKNGDWKWILSLSKIVSYDDHGKANRLIGIHIDIDDIKHKEIQLKALSDELAHSNRELEKFAYITSHNLRAPVVNIVSLLELLDATNFGNEQNGVIISKVQQSVLRLENTLNDLIEVVTAKKLVHAQKQAISIQTICKQVLANLESQLLKVDGEVILNFDNADEILYVKNVLESVFQNLITNSIKYRNPDKKLKIEISTHHDAEYTYIYVRDNGIGFDSDLMGQKIFKLYERLHYNIEGKGLGLYLIKTQIESLNGKIEVYSKPLEGAIFTVSIKKSYTNEQIK